MKRKAVWVIVLVVVLLGCGAAYWFTRKEVKQEVKTAVVKRGDLEVVVAASGRVEADVQVDVKSRASGEVVDILVQVGDVVHAGDLLVRLDPADEERRVQAAEADVTTARARLAQARSTLSASRANLLNEQGKLARRQSAYRGGLVSNEELQTAKTSAQVAREAVSQKEADISSANAAVSQAELAVEEARKRLSETIIRSVVDGTVLQVAVERGTIVASGISNVGGGTTLLTVADLSKLRVIVKLDEAGIGAVVPGQEARIRVDAFPDRVFSGVVERLTPLGVSEANIVTFDVNVRITDRAAHLLLPGMSTDVEIVTAKNTDVLLVPVAALKRAPRTRNGNGNGTSSGTGSVSSPEAANRDQSTSDITRETRVASGGSERPSAGEISGGREDGRRRDSQQNVSGRRGRRAAGDAGMSRASSVARDTALRENTPPMAPSPMIRPASERPARRATVQLLSGEERTIQVGVTDGVNTVVLEGLNEGDVVIIGGTGRDTGTQQPSSPFSMRGGRH